MFWWILSLIVIGAAMGSFACCQAWRLRYLETGKQKLGNRSICLSCKKQLRWFDNIPIVSWILLRGKCRNCGAKIGFSEILSEILMAIIFGLSGWYFKPWNGNIANLALMVVFFVIFTTMWMLLIYDLKWQQLPIIGLILINVLAIGFTALRQIHDMNGELANVLLSTGILAGLYFLLYKISNEKWVGGGDWILSLAIGVLLGHWWLALITLFVANFLAFGVMLPAATREEKKTGALGPFLIIGFLIVFLAQDFLLELI